MPSFKLIGTILFVCCICCSLQATKAFAADTTPPITAVNMSGTVGANNWYTSTINVNLRATDLESGPASTTYYFNSDSPTVAEFGEDGNSILNPSFELGSYVTLINWDKVTDNPANLYQSSLPSKFGQGSATVRGASATFQYWTNANYAVPVSVGQTYTTSVWVSTIGVSSGQGAWMEAWETDSTGVLADKLVATSTKVVGPDWDWQLLNETATIDAGYDHLYLKLGTQSDVNGQAFFDGAAMSTGTDGITQFSYNENGTHSFTYFSTDNEDNIEGMQTVADIKIDTVRPQDWSNFGYSNVGNNHTYTMWINVKDVTSGINPATAQFRTFDKDGCECWSGWMNVASVKQIDTGSAAPAGYTGMVQLATPTYDYGNSAKATMPEVQFQIDDQAASAGISPIYALFGPWVQVAGSGDVYSTGSISIKGAPPTGQSAVDGVVATGESTISGITSLQNWYVRGYPTPHRPLAGLRSFLPNIDELIESGQPFPSGRLPSATGIYLFNGTYTIDSGTLNAGFQGAVYNAALIIDGDLVINQSYQLNAGTSLVFLVTGQIIYSGSVTKSAGAMVAQGNISTGSGSNQLVHKGSLIAIDQLILQRDLGRKGNPNNMTTPAEKIEFQPQYLANPALARLLNGGTSTDFHWQETL